MRLGRGISFWTLAVVLGMLLLASSAPTPLYVVYQQEWGFSDTTLTVVFAIYVLALLTSVLVLGASGIGETINHMPAINALWETGFGQAILVKTGLLAAAIAIAAAAIFAIGSRLLII